MLVERLTFRAHPHYALLVRRAFKNEEPGWHAFCIEHCKCSFRDSSPFVAYELMLAHVEGRGGVPHQRIGKGH